MGKALLFLTFFLLSSISVYAQRDRLILAGHLHPKARPESDIGSLDPGTQLQNLTVILRPSAAQQADLDTLLRRQQDPSSADFHRWLTPEQYAERFGLPQTEIDKITNWLGSQALTVNSVARGHDVIAFSGSVGNIEKAFATPIHKFNVNGEIHFANTQDPAVPALIGGLVASIHGLHDFRLHPSYKPRYTSSSGASHYLAPDDLATIYNIKPLYASGIDGTNQKIAIVGQTQLPLSDIQQFRTYFNLAPKDPRVTLVPNTKDPGVTDGDLGEADLDVEWAGAVARNADISYVYSFDVTDALYYVIDQNLAPIVSMSYGLCESDTGQSDLTNLRTYARRANTQGITWIAASGDSGANDCYVSTARTAGKLGVDAPASIPEVTGIGGTTFTEGSGSFWSSNDANHSSALSYIPESAWNDSVADGEPSSSGGGASSFFTKPDWQTGTGVPVDGWRDVPDISLSASADHDGYLVYTAGSLQVIGGTSAGAPTFAGATALLNHFLTANGLQSTAGVGNVNTRLYTLAQSVPNAFHDIVAGDNMVSTCAARARGGCITGDVGYKTGVGYDQATGLGSVDVFTMVTNWMTGLKPRTVVSLSIRSVTQADGSMTFTSMLSPSDGGAATGTITFFIGGVSLGAVTLPANSLTVRASQLTTGDSVVASYSGNYPSASATVSLLSITAVTSAASFKPSYAPGMIAAVFGTHLASATQTAPALPLPTTLATTTVTINGTPAPLYFVSPEQINVQIPASVSAGSTAILKIINGSQSATIQFTVASAAPAIFLDQNGALPGYPSASRGQTIAMYITGDGGSSNPKVSTGGIASAVVYAGVPSWSVGVTQINFTVPPDAPSGAQQVKVTVGAVTSAPAILNITQ